jgi:heme exporter protein A
VAQNLTFLLNLYGITPSVYDIDEALAWVGLQGFETISSSHLSAGQTRRITLARLYLLSPDVTPLWLLDEPFTALDVDMVARMQERLQAFAAAGGAIIMTSHQAVDVANQVLDLSAYLDLSEHESLEPDLSDDEDLDIP